MGQVLATIRVMPDGVEVDLEKLKNKIISAIKPEKIGEMPVAFGLKAIMVQKIIPDSEGGTEGIEQKISRIDGVQSVETTDVTLI